MEGPDDLGDEDRWIDPGFGVSADHKQAGRADQWHN